MEMVLQKGFISLNEQELEYTDGGAVTTDFCTTVVSTTTGLIMEKAAQRIGAKIGGTIGAAIGGPVGSFVLSIVVAGVAGVITKEIID